MSWRIDASQPVIPAPDGLNFGRGATWRVGAWWRGEEGARRTFDGRFIFGIALAGALALASILAVGEMRSTGSATADAPQATPSHRLTFVPASSLRTIGHRTLTATSDPVSSAGRPMKSLT